ncbi:SHOCT domain-containing protein [Latilactobacillus fuchuensis]|jgi:hypothetical protein|uniref:SHOCT domain-containing protein n=3 Tax=Latilactobacillus fuchuensis TaxID=164393 RepID=A0A2N9DU24_9LACO|nr:hypothetical protein [Latilactobacillus fuchuensis]KRL61834.1 hypothetical protein FC69_GL001487 [Latilactobacillus fuchuensis DSM 14340 = JCM 11249]MCP8856792.1 hypothetical protein [Latilactobacillus fuchuensis]SPC37521.1 conserved hypothetical protein [Latilactobacillus fuchuensis]
MQTYLIKKPQKLEITYDEQILALHYPSLFKKKQNEDREIPFSKIKSVRFFEATYRHGHLQVLYQKPNHALEKVVIDFDTDDNLELRRIYTILADYLERPAEEDLSYVKTGELIMAYLKMRDEGLMTEEEFEEKKRRILKLED